MSMWNDVNLQRCSLRSILQLVLHFLRECLGVSVAMIKALVHGYPS